MAEWRIGRIIVCNDAAPNFGQIEPFEMHREEGIMFQTMDFEIGFADFLKWVRLPASGEEVRRADV